MNVNKKAQALVALALVVSISSCSSSNDDKKPIAIIEAS